MTVVHRLPSLRPLSWGVGLVVVLLATSGCGSETRAIPYFGGTPDTGQDVGSDDVDDGGGDTGVPDVVPDGNEETSADIVDEEVEEPAPPFQRPVASVDTRLSASRTTAGTVVYVTCLALDRDGEPMLLTPAPQTRFVISPSEAFQRQPEPNAILPTRVGEAAVACGLPEWGLVDTTPARLLVEPGNPAYVVTTLPSPIATAGQTVTATCEAWDAYGNAIEGLEASLRTDPFGSGVTLEGRRATIRTAGRYELACELETAAVVIPAGLEVVPSLPATAVLGLSPDLPRYDLGQVVTLVPLVQDRYGNRIQNPRFAVEGVPAVPSFGGPRLRFDTEGTFIVAATIPTPTTTGMPIRAEREVVVSGSGPAIECDSPGHARAIVATPGGTVRFEGRVSDEFGVASVTVNDLTATLGEAGGYAVTMPVRFGINFAAVVATDELGETSRRICAFVVADRYLADDAFLDGAIALRLAQDAFDDRVPNDGFDSLNDFLVTVLNSRGLRDTLHTTLLAANPLYPSTCVVDSFLGCLTRVSVTYRDIRLTGPHATSLTLVDGGLRAVATVRGIGANLAVGGTFSTSGWVNVESLTIDMTFDVDLAAGRPRVALRNVNDVQVGRVSADLSGLVGFVVELVVDIFQRTIRDLIRDTIRDYVRDSFNDVLDGVLGGLDIDTLASTFDVDRLDGSGTIALNFDIRISDVLLNPARALFGIGPRMAAEVTRATESPGAALPPGPTRFDDDISRTVVAGVNLGMLNQALHALWRASFFDATLGGVDLGDDLPAGASGALRLDLPIVVGASGTGAVRAMVGAATVQVVYPGIFDEPIPVELGAVAELRVRIEGDSDIVFDSVTLPEFYFDTGAAALDATSEALLEEFLRRLISSVATDALNGALPTLPIPGFDIPASLSVYDLPGGSTLRLLSPVIEVSPAHFVAGGNFGVR